MKPQNESTKEYEERSYQDTSLAPNTLPTHLYDHPARQSQNLVFRGITCAGKTYTARLLTNQPLRLSPHSKKDARAAEQVNVLDVVLNSFGAAKTFRHSHCRAGLSFSRARRPRPMSRPRPCELALRPYAHVLHAVRVAVRAVPARRVGGGGGRYNRASNLPPSICLERL
ncbi:hypothetical protein EXIGLDRAFT_774793 [Exidia glandulosa HHB12029]|uniref:Uncharacterized protein n=1 Tax=Exidia glandulosa HHB12029 TaxID=1314781 RepID=A0A165E7V0_EXIGL|nr:hypothetical protein EXIGLDRAFT_774793 [Exidia glandulosa HHB12029]